MTSSRSTKSGALLLFAFVIVAWGLNWTVTKLIVTQVTPLWTTAIRTGIGALALLAMLATSKQFRIPKRGDVPVVLAISLFHIVNKHRHVTPPGHHINPLTERAKEVDRRGPVRRRS